MITYKVHIAAADQQDITCLHFDREAEAMSAYNKAVADPTTVDAWLFFGSMGVVARYPQRVSRN